MPAANSGLSSPVSAASHANRRTAAKRRFIVAGASRRDSNSSRYRITTTRPNANLGSEQYRATKSSMANSYARLDAGEPKMAKSIGPDHVAVPTHTYKVVLCVRPNGAMETYGFVLPNIDKVGLDFFGALPAAEQSRLERMPRTLPER
jgi:hypothetical protein